MHSQNAREDTCSLSEVQSHITSRPENTTSAYATGGRGSSSRIRTIEDEGTASKRRRSSREGGGVESGKGFRGCYSTDGVSPQRVTPT
mmetsp:Transcript_38208/g.85933  ORF Transcript_38208/g.85933 Transcript_38208/m.85933 type:complete len:88 (+) Transcript_38208:1211-1474(+)